MRREWIVGRELGVGSGEGDGEGDVLVVDIEERGSSILEEMMWSHLQGIVCMRSPGIVY